jgi:hypothetical protein
MRRWTAKPNSKITMLENLSIGLAYIQKDMAIKLVGIGAEGPPVLHPQLLTGRLTH